mmetsp:Transcript_21821/g.34972  ORF Transcript_21821/g.34972 Transcript_21821/m.34972 type:complete len:225 (-) Transcript_21821:481-1155(-)
MSLSGICEGRRGSGGRAGGTIWTASPVIGAGGACAVQMASLLLLLRLLLMLLLSLLAAGRDSAPRKLCTDDMFIPARAKALKSRDTMPLALWSRLRLPSREEIRLETLADAPEVIMWKVDLGALPESSRCRLAEKLADSALLISCFVTGLCGKSCNRWTSLGPPTRFPCPLSLWLLWMLLLLQKGAATCTARTSFDLLFATLLGTSAGCPGGGFRARGNSLSGA